jgi:hypothetical protein
MLIVLASNVFAFQNLIDSVGGEVDPWFRSSGLKLGTINYGNLTLNGNAFIDNLTVTGDFITTNIEDYNVSGSIRLTGCVEYDSGVIDCGVNRTQSIPLKFYGDLNMTGNSITNVHNISGASPITILDDVVLGQTIFGDGQGLYNLNLSNSYGGYIDKYSVGNFVGSLYTQNTDSSLSDSNALFTVISDTRGTPQFQIQNGGPFQASFIARSFMVVNQNNTLLNSSQNNDCRSWGAIHADCNTASTGADLFVTDDIEALGVIHGDSGLRAASTESGAYLVLEDYTVLYNGSNAEFNATTNILCDYTANNFVAGSSSQWINIIEDQTIYDQARADINTFINSSCIELKHNPAWNTDFTGYNWETTSDINLIVQSGGFFEYYVGSDPESTFKIKVNNGTSEKGGLYIDDVAGASSHPAFRIDQDLNGNQVNVVEILATSSQQIVNKQVRMFDMIADASNMNSSVGVFIEMTTLGTPLTNDSLIDGIHMPTGMNKLIKVGSPDIVDSVYYQATNITNEILTPGLTFTIFTADNDVLYIGNDGNFTDIGITLFSGSSVPIDALYYYCDNIGNWQILPGVTSSTSGFENSGSITFNNPIDRGTCNQQLDGTPFSDTTNYTYIAIQRTRNNIVTPPVINIITISGANTNMYMKDDLLRLNPVDTAPEICDINNLGAIYFDQSEDDMCICKSTGWRVMSDGTVCV